MDEAGIYYTEEMTRGQLIRRVKTALCTVREEVNVLEDIINRLEIEPLEDMGDDW